MSKTVRLDKNIRPKYMLSTVHFKYKDTECESKGMQKIYRANKSYESCSDSVNIQCPILYDLEPLYLLLRTTANVI